MKSKLKGYIAVVIIFIITALYANSVARDQLETTVKIIIWSIATLGVAIVLGFLVYGFARIRAEITMIARNAAVMVVTADQNQQVFIRDSNTAIIWHNTALEPRAQFGHSSPEATQTDRQQWLLFKQVQMTNNKLFKQLADKTALTEALPAPSTPVDLPAIVHLENMVQPDDVSLNQLVLGVGHGSEVIRGSLKELSHIGVGGTSQWGKSIFLQSLLYQILLAKEQTEVYLSDIGGTSFVDFNLPYADDIASTEKMCAHLWDKVMERKALYQATGQGIRSLDMYNQVADTDLPYLVFFADETTVLMSQSKPLTKHLLNLVAYAGKYGLELILAGQNWKANNVDSAVRDQFSSRFQFKAMDHIQSNILIRDSQADGISVKGRACAYLPERGKLALQAPHIEVATIQAMAATKPIAAPSIDDLQFIVNEQPTSLPSNDEMAAIKAYETIRDSGKFSWNKAVKAAYGNNKTGVFYHDKLKKVLDKFGVNYN